MSKQAFEVFKHFIVCIVQKVLFYCLNSLFQFPHGKPNAFVGHYGKNKINCHSVVTNNLCPGTNVRCSGWNQTKATMGHDNEKYYTAEKNLF